MSHDSSLNNDTGSHEPLHRRYNYVGTLRARVGACMRGCVPVCIRLYVSVSLSQIRLGTGSTRICRIWDRDYSGPGISVVTNIVFD